jgi:hypothetical protein
MMTEVFKQSHLDYRENIMREKSKKIKVLALNYVNFLGLRVSAWVAVVSVSSVKSERR